MSSMKEISGFTFEAHQGAAGFERLLPAWTALVDSMPTPRFVHYPEWYRAYMTSLESESSRLWFVAAYRNRALIAVFPMQFQDLRLKGLRPRVFGTIDNDEMQSSDFVYQRTTETEKLLSAFAQWLRSQRKIRWDELRLRKVREDSAIAHSARAELPKATVLLLHDGCSYFQTQGSVEQATASMSGSFRRNLRRLAKRAEQSAKLRVETYRSSEELEKGFQLFVEIEASGWKGDAGLSSAIRCRPAMLAFYRGVMREFSVRNACVINVLWHGDTPVAGQFCLQIGTTLNILKIGFSEAHAKIAPGNLLLERIIAKSCADNGIDFVSLVNDPSWARTFKPLRIGVWSYCAPNWTVRGGLVHLGLLAKRRIEARGNKRGGKPDEVGSDKLDTEAEAEAAV
jgi:CelD/BcsL family acetyltransferase involved in cellulose biosynthesis